MESIMDSLVKRSDEDNLFEKSRTVMDGDDIDDEQQHDDGQEYLQTSLHQAARDGDAKLIRDILENKFNKSKKQKLSAINRLDTQMMTPLHYAAKYAKKEAAEVLIDMGADPTIMGDDGCIPLHFVVKYRPDVVRSASESDNTVDNADEEEDGEKRARVLSFSEDAFIETLKYLIEVTVNHENAKSDSKSFKSLSNDDKIIDSDDAYGDSPLHYAIARQNTKAARILLENGANANDVDKQRTTPLYMAAKNGDVESLKLLLEFDGDLSIPDEDGTTPLQIAASEGEEHHVEFLKHCFFALEQGKAKYGGLETKEAMTRAIQDFDHENANLLHYAIESENVQLIRLVLGLVKHLDHKLVNKHKANGDTAIHLAAEKGHVTIVRELVRRGGRVDSYNQDRETPLYLAAKNNHHSVVRFLAMKSPKSISKTDGDGWSPLLIAASNGHTEACECLLDQGANYHETDKSDRTLVFIAASEGHFDFLDNILKRPAIKSLVNERDQYQNTPCHIASEKGYKRAVDALKKAGADIGLKNDEEQTPMHLAAKSGEPNLIKTLHRYDPKLIHDWDENSDIPLHVAASNGHYGCVKWLIEFGSEIDASNTKGWTPLDCAADNGAVDVCKLLLDKSAPVDATDRTKITPLHLACKGGHEDVVQLLLKRGADCALIDAEGRNALDYAIDYYHEECVEILLNSPQWNICLSNSVMDNNSGSYVTPMRKLIQYLPEQARLVFNKCITIKAEQQEYTLADAPRKVFELKQLSVKFKFDFMDDDYNVAEWDKMEKQESEKLETTVSIDGDVESKVRPAYETNKKKLIANHPLMWIIDHQQSELIAHPLIVSLYNSKWNTLGWYVYYANLSIYMVFMLLLNVYALTTPPPYSYDLNVTRTCPNGGVAIVNDAKNLWCGVDIGDEECCYDVPAFRVAIIWIVIATAGARMFFEITQWIHEGIEYVLDVTNLLEWCLYIFSTVFVIDISQTFAFVESPVSMRTDWQWQLGSIAVWLSWMVLLLFIQKLPKLGIYILMFNTIIKTFMRFVSVFILFLLGFSISFFMLVQNQGPFDTMGKAFGKSLVMMIGEFEYEGIFEFWRDDFCDDDADCPGFDAINFYHNTMYVMFVIFIITMTIIVSNMLVGLAVDDIKAVQETAVLQRQALKIKLALESVYQAPNRWRYKWSTDYTRNKLSLDKSSYPYLERFQYWLDPDSSITRSKLLNLQARYKTDTEEIHETVETIDADMNKVKGRMRTMEHKLDRIEQLMESLVKHHQVDVSEIKKAE